MDFELFFLRVFLKLEFALTAAQISFELLPETRFVFCQFDLPFLFQPLFFSPHEVLLLSFKIFDLPLSVTFKLLTVALEFACQIAAIGASVEFSFFFKKLKGLLILALLSPFDFLKFSAYGVLEGTLLLFKFAISFTSDLINLSLVICLTSAFLFLQAGHIPFLAGKTTFLLFFKFGQFKIIALLLLLLDLGLNFFVLALNFLFLGLKFQVKFLLVGLNLLIGLKLNVARLLFFFKLKPILEISELLVSIVFSFLPNLFLFSFPFCVPFGLFAFNLRLILCHQFLLAKLKVAINFLNRLVELLL